MILACFMCTPWCPILAHPDCRGSRVVGRQVAEVGELGPSFQPRRSCLTGGQHWLRRLHLIWFAQPRGGLSPAVPRLLLCNESAIDAGWTPAGTAVMILADDLKGSSISSSGNYARRVSSCWADQHERVGLHAVHAGVQRLEQSGRTDA